MGTPPFTFPAGGLRLPGLGITLFTYSTNPVGQISGSQAGDLCVTTEPALYQWSAAATPTWVPFGSTAGDLSAYTTADGISLTDTGSGVYLYETAGGNTAGIGIFEGEVAFETNGGTWSFNVDGTTTVPAHGEMDPITIFTNGENPNGDITGNFPGDLCITGEPGLYQWNTALATPMWVPYESVRSAEAIYHFDCATTSPYGQIFETGTVKLVGGDAPGPEYVDFTVATPAFAYPPGSIMNAMNMDMFQLPPSPHAFVVEIIMALSDQDGTNKIKVDIVTTGVPGASNVSLDPPLGATVTQTGTDLVWDDSFATLSTVAGGLYGMMVSFQTHWAD